MKKILLHLLGAITPDYAKVIEEVKNEYMLIRPRAISVKNYQSYGSKNFEEQENHLYSYIQDHNYLGTIDSLEMLRRVYRGYGEKPNDNFSGFHEMLRFLDEIAEAIDVIANYKDSAWK